MLHCNIICGASTERVMIRLGDTVARRATAGRLHGASGQGGRLVPFAFSGPNPGALDALAFAAQAPAGAGLVVVLHGCTQTASGYDQGSGWSRHGEAEGFAVLYPQQRRANMRASASIGSRPKTLRETAVRRRPSPR